MFERTGQERGAEALAPAARMNVDRIDLASVVAGVWVAAAPAARETSNSAIVLDDREAALCGLNKVNPACFRLHCALSRAHNPRA